jgi:hypothetical protein
VFSLTQVPIKSQLTPIRTFTPYAFKINFNLILSYGEGWGGGNAHSLVIGSNLIRDNGYHGWGFRGFAQYSKPNTKIVCKSSKITVTTKRILGSKFYDQPLILCYMFRSHKDHHQVVLHEYNSH